MSDARHPVSQAIRTLYEAYPYPQRLPGGGADPYLDFVLSFGASSPPATPSFLDAGCGTGVNTLGAAMMYPTHQIFGCDLNRVALAQIEEEARNFGLDNLALREVDLLDFPTDWGPSEGFDIIFSIGVIHHTPDPVGILKQLADRLAPQGILRLMVYGEYGRTGLYRFAQVMGELLEGSPLSLPQRLEQARHLMSGLQASGQRSGLMPPVLRGPWADAADLDDVEFVDRYLNPHDQPFTLPRLREAIEQAGLQFLSWFEPDDWDLEKVLPELAASDLSPTEDWSRFALIERLFDRPKLDLYLVKPGFRKQSQDVDVDTLLGTNPQLFLNQISLRGRPLQQSARLRLGAEQRLEPAEGRLVSSLGNRWATLGQLCSEWGENPQHWLLTASSLVQRQLLFKPHPPQP